MRPVLLATLCLAVLTSPVLGDQPLPTSQPAPGKTEYLEPEVEAFLKSDLPKDIPLPEKTPFDDDKEEREKYIAAYKDGFAGAVIGMRVIRCGSFSPATAAGYRDGETAGENLHSLRQEAESDRRFALVHADSVPITDKSPEADRNMRDDFTALSERFLNELRSSYPQALTITNRETPPSVYTYQYHDYSGSNTGKFVPRRRFRAVVSFDVKISAPKAKGPEDNELHGTYSMDFEYLDDRWTIASPVVHFQETGRQHGAIQYEGRDSALAGRLLNQSFERAAKSAQP